MEPKDMLDMAVAFHGHRCPAMPLGLRAGFAAMRALGVERASNKELFCYLEVGPAHAMMCFGDGVQVSTGCTYGKGTIEKTEYGKTAITLIDVENKRAVRVALKPEFQKKALESTFVQLRKKGIEPKDIEVSVVDPLIEKVMMLSTDELFNISDPFAIEFKRIKGTFNWFECEGCGEVVFENVLRVIDGKKLCVPCAEG
ncbi:MAG: formylmethanofuran dehydrogenase, partial [Candidatus Latescibacteria bacterium 4484_7]